MGYLMVGFNDSLIQFSIGVILVVAGLGVAGIGVWVARWK